MKGFCQMFVSGEDNNLKVGYTLQFLPISQHKKKPSLVNPFLNLMCLISKSALVVTFGIFWVDKALRMGLCKSAVLSKHQPGSLYGPFEEMLPKNHHIAGRPQGVAQVRRSWNRHLQFQP